jgi:PAS domain S-box-containing protein
VSERAAPDSEAFRALREESAEELYESAPCGYLSTLPDGTIARVNRTLLGWLGYSSDELTGRRLQDLLSVGGKVFYETHVGPLLSMQGFVNEVQLDLVCKGGALLPVLANMVQKRDGQGQSLFLRTSVFKISDRRQYERELQLERKRAESAAQAKADFLSMVSHEIRTPMNAIVGITSLLQKTALSPQQQRYVRILGTSSENLLELLNSILDFSKMEAGKVTLEEQRFDLRQLVFQTVYALSGRAEEKHLALSVAMDERVPALVRGDPVKLGQVLTNLVSNAIKFTASGSVTLSVRLHEPAPADVSADRVVLEFQVTDTGIGIAGDRLSAIFEEFTQASADIGVRYGGTGLGLAISQRLLALHDSRLGVTSELGKGSTFSFTLRLRREQGEAPAPSEPAALSQRLDGLRVLVAEDNEINVLMLSQFLSRWGVVFDVVGDGHQAVHQVQQAPYDVVLMDLQMPGLNGYDATRAIRALADERYGRLPVIAVTASARLGLEARLDQAGFSDFIGKPFKPEDLFAKLRLHSASHVRDVQPRPGPGEAMAPPRFDLKPLRALAGDEPAAYAELLRLTLSNSEKHRRGFRTALLNRSREEFDYHLHKMRVLMELLKAEGLRDALTHAARLLEEGAEDPAPLEDALRGVEQELAAITQALKHETP